MSKSVPRTAEFAAPGRRDRRNGGALEQDDFSSNRHPAPVYCWSMIFSENRYPLFGIMP